MSIESLKVPPTLVTTCSKKTKPRAIIFRSNNKDFDMIRKLIETQFSKVEILYVTTGPVASVLRVTKSILKKIVLSNQIILLRASKTFIHVQDHDNILVAVAHVF